MRTSCHRHHGCRTFRRPGGAMGSSPPYNDLDSTYYDDKTMRDAVDEVKKTDKWKGSDYNVISHNCQDFVSEVIRTYHLIKGR